MRSASRSARAALPALALGLSLAACGADGDPAATPGDEPSPAPSSSSASAAVPSASPSSATPTAEPPDGPDDGPTGPAYSTWPLGARPLPLRDDGYGEVRRTPRTLRVRRYPTEDRLAPPPGGRWRATVRPVTPDVRRRMGATWSPRCPVALDDLRHLTVAFRGFDGRAHTGELVVAAAEAADVVSVFRALFRADFPIEEMRLPGTRDLEAPPTGDGNNTAGLVCRATTAATGWSAHAYGQAIDVNPFQNPYLRDDLVLPELASSYLDRSWRRPGMVLDGDLVVREFARVGWSWGGAWRTLKDYQHFSALDR